MRGTLRITMTLLVAIQTIIPLPGAAQSIDSGKKLFALHCAACHGPDARGTGAVGEALPTRPEDLTSLARRHGGTFPMARTVASIDRRTPVAAHGSDMPVYGWFFAGPAAVLDDPEGGPIETTQAIAAIVLWLQSVQR